MCLASACSAGSLRSVVDEGGGIQRSVELIHTTGAARLVSDGLFAPARANTAGSTMLVTPTAEVIGLGAGPQSVRLRYTLWDGPESVANATTTSQPVAPGSTATVVTGGDLRVAEPKLWSVRRPYLYRLTAQLLGGASGDQVIDAMNTTLGLRILGLGMYLTHFPTLSTLSARLPHRTAHATCRARFRVTAAVAR